jgi:integrase
LGAVLVFLTGTAANAAGADDHAVAEDWHGALTGNHVPALGCHDAPDDGAVGALLSCDTGVTIPVHECSRPQQEGASMATIVRRTNQDGTTVYLVRVRRKGVPPQTATFAKRSDARRWAQMIEGAIIEGRRFPMSTAKRYTLNDLIDRYVQTILPHKSISHASMQRQQLRWWRTQLGHYALTDITSARIAECRDRLAPGRSSATVNRYLSALSFAFTIAVRKWQRCEDNPVWKVRKPKEPRGRVRFLSDAERERLLAACQASRNRMLYALVVLALSTGARRGELLGLTWDAVDLQRGLLIFHETKNGERGSVPVTGYALSLLCRHHTERCTDTSFVFPSCSGERPTRIRRAWDAAVKHANLHDFRFHDLRHSAASYLAMNGASLIEIADILGHKTLSMVRRYAHLSESHTRVVVERMNRTIFGE